MATGLKNAGDVIPDVLDVVDFCVNEQCAEFQECEVFSAFVKAGKPVFQIEYPESAPDISDDDMDAHCNSTGSTDFNTVLKEMDLNGWVELCNGETFETQLAE
jgi:hypothetical protein